MGLVPIVEGHGEVDAVPILLRRLLERHGAHYVGVERPIRLPRGRLVNRDLACLDHLRGQRGIREDAEVPPDPEAIRGAKEYLQRQMLPGWVYSETVDQPALTRLLNLELARARSPSFDKLYREVGRIAAHFGSRSQV